VSTTSAHYIVHRVSAAIARLRPHYIRLPTTEEEIRNAQLQFYNITRFPRVIGCVQQKKLLCNCCKIRELDWCMLLLLTESKSIHQSGSRILQQLQSSFFC